MACNFPADTKGLLALQDAASEAQIPQIHTSEPMAETLMAAKGGFAQPCWKFWREKRRVIGDSCPAHKLVTFDGIALGVGA